jgi:hypothetical protein
LKVRASAVAAQTMLQKASPTTIRIRRDARSTTYPASGAERAYTSMNAEPISPFCSLLRPNSAFRSGNTEKTAWRSA